MNTPPTRRRHILAVDSAQVLVRLPVADALSSPDNCKPDLTVFGEDGRNRNAA